MKLSDLLFIAALVVFAPGAIFLAYGVIFLALVIICGGAALKASGH
ncbi:hypothetical protein [Gryllotalpicola koreensis]|uniref:DUF3096 domain-containing protein n=1 Tax=Gryllotalpicola koreensis TaxID=993086 RepID=A0ABP8A2A7_9MICO